MPLERWGQGSGPRTIASLGLDNFSIVGLVIHWPTRKKYQKKTNQNPSKAIISGKDVIDRTGEPMPMRLNSIPKMKKYK